MAKEVYEAIEHFTGVDISMMDEEELKDTAIKMSYNR